MCTMATASMMRPTTMSSLLLFTRISRVLGWGCTHACAVRWTAT